MRTECHSKILNVMSGVVEGIYYGLVLGSLIITVSIATGGVGFLAIVGISIGTAAVGGCLGGLKGHLDYAESRDDARDNQVLLARIADNLDVLRESAVRENSHGELSADSHTLIMSRLSVQAEADMAILDQVGQVVTLYQAPLLGKDAQSHRNEAVFQAEEKEESTLRVRCS